MRTLGFGLVLAATLLMLAPATALADLATTTFDPVRIDRGAGDLVISGTISCTEPEEATVSAFVTQATREAGDSTTVACDVTPVPWVIRLPLGAPPFHPGPAVLDIGFAAGATVSGRSVDIMIMPR
jgi:hypothetical protein